MRKLALTLLLLLWSSCVSAEVLNVEFSFTPFTGDPANSHVRSVAGKALVTLNNVPISEAEVAQEEIPVLFEEREIAPSVWIPSSSLGPALRKGKNTLRVEFEPASPKEAYRAQLRWILVTDRVTKVQEPSGAIRTTNTDGEGVDDKNVTGRVVFEREFTADFATDRPWHHYPPVITLSDDDRKAIAALLKERLDVFKPDFAGVYKILQAEPSIDLKALKKLKCLEKSYAAGIRMTVKGSDQIE
ncbi:MAG: hypothetical protein ACLGPL_10405, partial [Acidobacteriota bacterium]